MSGTTKRSVSFALRDPGGAVMAVQRPPDDDELPLAWGLPAASLRPGEDWEAAVRRAAREKLGLEVDVGRVLNEGVIHRDAYILEMRLYAVTLADEAGGPPVEPDLSRAQSPGHGRTTRYIDWRWSDDDSLFEPAAAEGSLCCRLYLDMP